MVHWSMETTQASHVERPNPAQQQWPSQQDSRFFRCFKVVVPGGIGSTISVTVSPQIPDRWIVSVMPGPGLSIDTYLGPGAGGDAFPMGGGGKATLPSNYDAITFRNNTANAVTMAVSCERGYPGLDIDCGELA